MSVRKMVMNKKELAPGIVVYSNVIKDVDNLIVDIEEGLESARLEWEMSKVFKNGYSEIDTETRDTSIVTIPYKDSITDDFTNLSEALYSSLSNIFLLGFEPLELDYKRDHGVETFWHDGYSLLRYGKGQHFINHVDDSKDFHRRISLVYYLNDNYEGGEIEFPRFGVKYKPNANELLLFPSTYVYNHSVLPVVEGLRYSVVSWLR